MREIKVCAPGYVFGILATVILLSCEKAEARTVRIGVYDNPPKVEMSNTGTPCGIFIDIIEYIAEREGWNIEYVYGTWDAGLVRLQKGSIDLMPDVAYSEIRNRQFDFNQLSVLASWLQIYSRKDVAIGTVSDLDGKTVAVLEGSIQQEILSKIHEQFDLSFNLDAQPDYHATIRQVMSGKADALIVSRFYGFSKQRERSLVSTPVILNPSALHFAAPKGRNGDLLHSVDKHLAAMMNDPSSVYYHSMIRWLHEEPRMFVPRFVAWLIASITVILLLFFVLSMVLRWQVRKRTKELGEKNKELSEALHELKKARDDALKRERLYAFGQLANGIAHDFNNLLSPIVSYTDMMLVDPNGLEDMENVRQKLEVLKTSAMHGTEIIRRMQHFCRSANNAELKERVDINAMVGEVIELAKARWMDWALKEEATFEVVLKLGSNCEITGRKSDVHEMLLNLVLNAADAMHEGGRLEVSTENIDGAVIITVKDSGGGMTEEIREKCLQPFFTTKGENGTGMGLTMVNNIVAEHGGRMEIESQMGVGTSLIMTFPYAPKIV